MNFRYLKIIHFPHQRHHPKIRGDILQKEQIDKYVRLNEII